MGGHKCCVPTCSRRDTKNMFQFPSDLEICARWLENLGMADYTPKTADRVCHLHFSAQLIEFGERSNRLKKGAIPGDVVIVHEKVREICFIVEHCGKQGEVRLFETAKVSTLKCNVSSLTGCGQSLKIKFLHSEGFYWEAPEESCLSDLDLPIETKLQIVCPHTSPCAQGIVGDKSVREIFTWKYFSSATY